MVVSPPDWRHLALAENLARRSPSPLPSWALLVEQPDGVAVATARAQGLAALERARSEVASTRALANAAKLVASQPGLLQLRTLQAVEAGGATVVLSADPSGTAAALATS